MQMDQSTLNLKRGETKNIPKSSLVDHRVDEGMLMSIYKPLNSKHIVNGFSVPSSVIQFLFCAEGNAK